MSQRMTVLQLIHEAESNVSRGIELDAVARVRLEALLDQIFMDYVWDFLLKEPRATITLTQGSPTFTLPPDYLKFFSLVLTRPDLNPTQPPSIPLYKHSWADFQNIRVPGVQAPPQCVAINGVYRAEGIVPTGYVYPVPDQNYTAYLSYYFDPRYGTTEGDTGEDAAVPAFPDTKALLDLLTNELYGWLKDRRFVPGAVRAFVSGYRANMADDGADPRIAVLDQRKFKKNRGRPYSWGFNDTGR